MLRNFDGDVKVFVITAVDASFAATLLSGATLGEVGVATLVIHLNFDFSNNRV